MVFYIKNINCYNVSDLINDNPTAQIYWQEKKIKPLDKHYAYKKKGVLFTGEDNVVSVHGLVMPFFWKVYMKLLFTVEALDKYKL